MTLSTESCSLYHIASLYKQAQNYNKRAEDCHHSFPLVAVLSDEGANYDCLSL